MRMPLKFGTRKARFALIGLAVAGLAAIPSAVAAASTSNHAESAVKPTIVLEHGAWADGSSWSGVVTRLQKDGYTVDVPPNPLRGPAGDSAYLASYLATVPGPVVLVGHSYGGFVTTNAAAGDKNVKALVYVDAYIPAQGDTINSLTAQFPGSQDHAGGPELRPVPRWRDRRVHQAIAVPQHPRRRPAGQPGGRARRHPAADRGNRAGRGVGRRPGGASPAGPLSERPTTRSAGGAGVHGTTCGRHDDEDQRLAPVADLPARRGHERDRGGREPHVLGGEAGENQERRTTGCMPVDPAFPGA